MAAWSRFAEEQPDLASRVSSRFAATELVMLGTLTSDGSPRVSPVEPDIVDGELMIGMIWQSKKALDLRRDARCVVQSVLADRNDFSGDYKLRGRAWDVTEPSQHERYCQVIEARIDWRPEVPFHLFALDIERVWAFAYESGEKRYSCWRPGQSLVLGGET